MLQLVCIADTLARDIGINDNKDKCIFVYMSNIICRYVISRTMNLVSPLTIVVVVVVESTIGDNIIGC